MQIDRHVRHFTYLLDSVVTLEIISIDELFVPVFVCCEVLDLSDVQGQHKVTLLLNNLDNKILHMDLPRSIEGKR